MEGLREVALADYEILPDEEKSTIQRDFKQMVTDGNFSEYFKSIVVELRPGIIDQVLETCKEYKEGNLDFKDFIISKYILENRIGILCDGCSLLFIGRPFFSCYECFCNINGEDSYDLCCGCYSSKKFKDHNHQEFFNSHTLHEHCRTMFAKMKSDQDKRLEQVNLTLARGFLELAGEFKSKKYDYRDYECDPKEILGEISRRAIELKKMSDAAEKEDEKNFEENNDDAAAKKEDDKNIEENNDDVEILTRISTPRGSLDLLGMIPTI